ncbi:cation:proton antiporter [Desulfomonile tiedjei]|uniref:Kef-type K+ transport system, predicted NAD-binding component n=1 Tax=Desulfomonile tiedjei (strain ATCC 49306 / DSM 6799 / DCB-1) TaxID=706587 RepID=I4CF98_DESTA|nr:Kef-type K+ transport system, predicted NAD-binding component [Desulfomonile tiedjei DSM 6799]
MHHLEIIEILAIGLLAALVLGFVSHRLKLSPIVGYLLAGIIVGPHTPGFVADPNLAGQLAEVGVILLMFGVGLHFDLTDLLSVKGIAVPGAIVQSLIVTVLGTFVALAFGLSVGTGMVLGLALAVSSTVVMVRCLSDNRLLDTVHGHVAVGWLIVQDILTVLALVLLPMVTISFVGEEKGAVLTSLGIAVGKLVALGVLILPVVGKIVPWLLSHVARSRSRELFTLTILVLAFLIAAGSAMIFNASVALGAFLAGMVVGKTRVSHQAAADILPMRDAFAVLFFLSIGMLLDPGFLLMHPGLIAACFSMIVVVKTLVSCLLVLVLGYSVRTALTVAIGLAQIGEFSFLLSQQAQSLNLMPQEGFSVVVTCALISITLNPLLFKAVDPVENWLRGKKRLWGLLNYQAEMKARSANIQTQTNLLRHNKKPLAIVIGYGPVGQRVSTILRESEIQPIVVDLNVDTVSNLVSDGHPAIYGDGSHREILTTAGIERAKYLLITVPDLTSAIAIVTTALDLNPKIKTLVRSRFLYAKPILEGLGVSAISFEEEEVARAMTEALASEVSNSAEQEDEW